MELSDCVRNEEISFVLSLLLNLRKSVVIKLRLPGFERLKRETINHGSIRTHTKRDAAVQAVFKAIAFGVDGSTSAGFAASNR